MHSTVIQYKRLHFVQKSMGIPVTGCTPDAVRTAIKIQSTPSLMRKLSIHYIFSQFGDK